MRDDTRGGMGAVRGGSDHSPGGRGNLGGHHGHEVASNFDVARCAVKRCDLPAAPVKQDTGVSYY